MYVQMLLLALMFFGFLPIHFHKILHFHAEKYLKKCSARTEILTTALVSCESIKVHLIFERPFITKVKYIIHILNNEE